jgi:hypothetical protein
VVSATKSNQVFTISVATESGRTYAPEFIDTADATNWLPLPMVGGYGESVFLRDPTATNAFRFYRVRKW